MTPERQAGPETALAAARRHVAEAEKRVAQRRTLMEKMAGNQHPNVAAAEQHLLTMETTLYVMQKHLQFEEQEQEPAQGEGSDA